MELHPLPLLALSDDPWRRDVSRLVTTFGTPRFEQHLFQVLEDSLRCEHVTAFAVDRSGPPRLIFAANRGGAPIARSAGHRYLQHHWHADPTNQLLTEQCDLLRGVIASLSPEEMTRLEYRRACYAAGDWERGGANLIHKITLLKRQDQALVKVSFYRHRDAGLFDACDVRKIAESADLLVAFLARHNPIGTSGGVSALRERFERCLCESGHGLTRREAQVCAAIAVGMTSEAIALTLDISINTVLTFRKRAYARLAISSQNELLRIIYSNLHPLQ